VKCISKKILVNKNAKHSFKIRMEKAKDPKNEEGRLQTK
jgi:hypothetical protein